MGDFEIDKSLAPGAWGNRTRFLIPKSEALPTSRSDWRVTTDNVAIKPWMRWGRLSKMTLTHYACNTYWAHAGFAHKPFAPPPHVELRSSGGNSEFPGDWWGNWNPSAHINSIRRTENVRMTGRHTPPLLAKLIETWGAERFPPKPHRPSDATPSQTDRAFGEPSEVQKRSVRLVTNATFRERFLTKNCDRSP